MKRRKAPSRDELNDLLFESFLLDHSPQKVALLERAVRIADQLKDEESAYEIRQDLIDAAIFGGQPDRAIVAFSWCLAVYDRDPDAYEAYEILWKYKWIIDNAADFPTISRERIEDLLADQQRRYQAYGQNEHPHLQTRFKVYRAFGDQAKARQAMKQMDRLNSDELSDCKACSIGSKAAALIEWGDPDKALVLAAPILKGRLRCGEEPHRTIPQFLLPLVEKGQAEEAAQLHASNYRRLRRKPQFLLEHGLHMRYLAFIGQTQEALDLFEREWPAVAVATQPSSILQFYLAALFTLQRLKRAGVDEVKLRIPKDLPLGQPKKNIAVDVLIQWLEQETRRQAKAFDARNNNRHYQGKIAGLKRLHRQADDWQEKQAKGQS